MYCYSASKIAFVAQQCETDTLSATDATCLCSFDPILGRRSFTTYTRSVTRPIVGLVRVYAAVIHRRVNTTYVSRLVTSHIIREMPEAAAPAQPLPHPSSTNYRYGSLLAVDGFRQRTSTCYRWTPQTGRSGFGQDRTWDQGRRRSAKGRWGPTHAPCQQFHRLNRIVVTLPPEHRTEELTAWLSDMGASRQMGRRVHRVPLATHLSAACRRSGGDAQANW